MSPHAAHFSEALCALDLFLGSRDRWMPVQRRREAETRRWWHRCGHGRLLADTIRRVDELYSDEVLLGLPEPTRGHGTMGASVLWARIEGTEQVKRAARFRPLPSLVVREGASSRRLLLWPLRRWLPYFDVEDRNRKIAYRLGAVQRVGAPEQLWIPAPGCCLRVGRERPVPIVVSRLTADTFEADTITRRLRRPPEVKWWEARA